jgi:hypothetical protein
MNLGSSLPHSQEPNTCPNILNNPFSVTPNLCFSTPVNDPENIRKNGKYAIVRGFF